MAYTMTVPVHANYEIGRKQIAIDADAFKLVLLSGITYDEETHLTYTNVSGFEIAGTFGYTTGGLALARGANTYTKNYTDNQVEMAYDNHDIVASGGDIGPFQDVCIVHSVSGVIMGHFRRGTAKIVADGETYTLSGILMILGRVI